jgi:hypothetical protein
LFIDMVLGTHCQELKTNGNQLLPVGFNATSNLRVTKKGIVETIPALLYENA